MTTHLIWSHEHARWWASNAWGYTDDIGEAGRYDRDTAMDYCLQANRYLPAGSAPNEIPVLVEDAEACIRPGPKPIFFNGLHIGDAVPASYPATVSGPVTEIRGLEVDLRSDFAEAMGLAQTRFDSLRMGQDSLELSRGGETIMIGLDQLHKWSEEVFAAMDG